MTMLRRRKSPQGRQVLSAFLTMCRGDDQGLSDRRTIPSFSSCRNSALAAANFSASSRRKREAMGDPEVLMWCSTSVPTGGRTLDGHTTSSNSARNAFNHSGDSGGGAGGPAAPAAVSPPQRPVDPGDGNGRPALAAQAAASPPQRPVDSGDGGGWPALAAQAAVSPPQRPVDPGDGGDWTALAAPAAAAGTVAKDCRDAVSTRRLAAGSTNSLWLRKKSTPIMAKVTSARRNVHSNRRPWKSSCTTLSPQHGIRWPPAPVKSGPLGGDVER